MLDARAEGVARSVLFTDRETAPARRAYEALGYRLTGDFAIVILAER